MSPTTIPHLPAPKTVWTPLDDRAVRLAAKRLKRGDTLGALHACRTRARWAGR